MEDRICGWHNLVQYGFTASHHRIHIHGRGQARNVSSGCGNVWHWRIRDSCCRREKNGVWEKGNYFGAGPGEQELVGRAVRMMDCKGTEDDARINKGHSIDQSFSWSVFPKPSGTPHFLM